MHRSVHHLLLSVLILTAVHLNASAAPGESTSPFYNVVDYGAVGDGQTANTAAINKTIDACAEAGGGTVFIPAGKFVTGAIFMKSHVTLRLDAGCTLLGHENIDDYPVIDGRWEGIERKHYASLINGDGLEHIAIVGRGTIDARGAFWWKIRKQLPHARGRLIGLYRCNNVLIEGLTLKNSPAWTVNPIYCENVTITGLTVLNPDDSPNTDGINPDSSRNVRISNCHIDVGDDCITIKSGKDEDGRRVGKPCENITITNCTMMHGHGGVVIGSEMSGGVKNVVISNCVFDGTERGIRMKTQRGRGGTVENIRVNNIAMRNVDEAIRLNMHYHRFDREPVSERTPCFKNIHISNISVDGGNMAAWIDGLPEMPITDLTITGANFRTHHGLICKAVRNMELHDVLINTGKGPALEIKDSENVEIEGLKTRQPHADAPVVEMKNIRTALVRSCTATADTNVFLHIYGEKTADILLSGNHLKKAQTPVQQDNDLPANAVEIK